MSLHHRIFHFEQQFLKYFNTMHKQSNNKKSQSNFGKAMSPPLWQRMVDSSAACATSCAMPTTDKSNHSATGKLHPHHSATFFLYVTLCSPVPPPSEKNCLFPLGDPNSTIKSHPLAHPTTPNDIISIHTVN